MGFHLFILLLWLPTLASPSPVNLAKPHCQAVCGDLTIPYPFGVGVDCYRDQDFELTCNTTSAGQPQLYWHQHPVRNISLLGDMSISLNVSYECYDDDGKRYIQELNYVNGSEAIPFTFSNTRNKFTMIGCDTRAYINGQLGGAFKSGCVSYCKVLDSLPYLSCDGIGCCQTSIPKGIRKYEIELSSFNNYTVNGKFNSCSYAFLVDQTQFNLSTSAFFGEMFLQSRPNVPVVLDWAIKEDDGCKACASSKSECTIASYSGAGYLCKCSNGYTGNPYLLNGCQDIDECKDQNKHDCEETSYCHNRDGSFECQCPSGKKGDGKKQGNGCHRENHIPVPKIIIVTCLSFLTLLITGSWAYWMHNKRKHIKLKERFFQQNGGLLLQQLTSSNQNGVEVIKIFTADDLERATNKYHESQILGQGGSGTVYKGILPDDRVVAIKKAKITDESQIGHFINEIAILYKMNHRNMVHLFGCCLETEIPTLVYEFIENGTLHDHIHKRDHAGSISWDNRLRIAAETAGALAFLHSAASVPIIHRDVKSTNILLDKNFTAKVADFGASRLVPLDKAQVTTLVQGTLGYLDPEYFHTGQLSEKSDVYSYGVVLAELLTGEKPICADRTVEERILANYFISSVKKNRLFQVLEDLVASEGEKDQIIAVAQLARSCLMVKSEERPTMKEVATELERLRRVQQHPWISGNQEENDNLLEAASMNSSIDFGELSSQDYGEW